MGWQIRLLRRLLIIAGVSLTAGQRSVAAENLPLRYAQAYSSLRSVFSLLISVAERAGFFVASSSTFN